MKLIFNQIFLVNWFEYWLQSIEKSQKYGVYKKILKFW